MSPMDSGVSPAPQNLNIDMEPGSGNAAEQIMPFSAMDAEAGEQTGPSFLDSAFYETFSGPSPPSLNDADGENAEKVDGAGVPSESIHAFTVELVLHELNGCHGYITAG
ncbi:myb-like DNA-binding protein bas1 [Fusarium piperis]|uniref:Myb-like DNA-binding protein bas1 n=1 Tax=Fusarium piperis TaxID=1435070 RepID=A0A9W8T8J3_9HYPO|nr:myb-like DNA-binding protein bas1 [Fusarium piperis]